MVRKYRVPFSRVSPAHAHAGIRGEHVDQGLQVAPVELVQLDRSAAGRRLGAFRLSTQYTLPPAPMKRANFSREPSLMCLVRDTYTVSYPHRPGVQAAVVSGRRRSLQQVVVDHVEVALVRKQRARQRVVRRGNPVEISAARPDVPHGK